MSKRQKIVHVSIVPVNRNSNLEEKMSITCHREACTVAGWLDLQNPYWLLRMGGTKITKCILEV